MKNYLFLLGILLIAISCQDNEDLTLDPQGDVIDQISTRKAAPVECDCDLTVTELDGNSTLGSVAFLEDSDLCDNEFFFVTPFGSQTIEDLTFPDVNWPDFTCQDGTILNGTELILDIANNTNMNAPICYNLNFELNCGGNVGTINVSRHNGLGLRLFEVVFNGVGCDATPVSICHPPIPDWQNCSFCE